MFLRLYYLHISFHLLIGYPKEVLAGTSVAETTCAEMDVVQTGHSVYLGGKGRAFIFLRQLKKNYNTIFDSICLIHLRIANYLSTGIHKVKV